MIHLLKSANLLRGLAAKVHRNTRARLISTLRTRLMRGTLTLVTATQTATTCLIAIAFVASGSKRYV